MAVALLSALLGEELVEGFGNRR